MVGRQLPFFSLLIPFWIVGAYAGWRGMVAVWPASLTAGAAFPIPQFLVSNYHGPWLVDIISGACSIGAVVLLLRFWKPKELMELPVDAATTAAKESAAVAVPRREVARAWMPWAILTALLLLWGTPQVKSLLDKLSPIKIAVPGLHNVVQRSHPVAPPNAPPEKAEFRLNLFSATGTGILAAALISGLLMGYTPRQMFRTYGKTLWHVRFSLLTIAAMLALGNVTKYSGTDATLGLALAHTGGLYPFFGTLLGWLGVALTGSDTIPARLESEEEKDGWTHVRFKFEKVEYIARWLLRFGREARAVEPAALREAVAIELQQWLAESQGEYA
jgi:lactate permease